MPPKKILIICGDFTETLELYCPLFTLQSMGFICDIACPNKNKGEPVTTCVHDFSPSHQTYTEKPGHCCYCTVTLNDINPKDYDGLYLPGGRAPEYLRCNPKVMECVKCFITCGKPIAAMCHGPQILLATGLMSGKKMCPYPTVFPECTLANVEPCKVPNDECIVDGNIITGPTWMSCPKMMCCFTEMLGCKVTPPPTGMPPSMMMPGMVGPPGTMPPTMTVGH